MLGELFKTTDDIVGFMIFFSGMVLSIEARRSDDVATARKGLYLSISGLGYAVENAKMKVSHHD